MSNTSRIRRAPCDKCGSKDNVAIYPDNSSYCFTPGCGAHTRASDSPLRSVNADELTSISHDSPSNAQFKVGVYSAIPKRGITEDTCRFWGYSIGKDRSGNAIQIASYKEDGKIVRQVIKKIVDGKKTFPRIGDCTSPLLYGKHLWTSGRMIVITEGELDAMSVSQAMNNKYPVVSISGGAGSAKDCVAAHKDWLEKNFDAVVLMLDMDEPGREATKQCARILKPGYEDANGVKHGVFIAELPLKDANEMIMANRDSELVKAIWSSKPYRDDSYLAISDIDDDEVIKHGLKYPWPTVDKLLYGIQPGTMTLLVAGTGKGKTTFLKNVMIHLLDMPDVRCGTVLLEDRPAHIKRSMIGLKMGAPIWLPDAVYDEKEYKKAKDWLENRSNLIVYKDDGHTNAETIVDVVRRLVTVYGCTHVFIDHLTALQTGIKSRDKVAAVADMMAGLRGLTIELGVTLFLTSQVRKAGSGDKAAGEGRYMNLNDIHGGGDISHNVHTVISLLTDEEDRPNRFTYRILKDRLTGQATNKCVNMVYEAETGRTVEADETDDLEF